MKVRTRITMDEDVYKVAVNYSKLDNRTFSQLMQHAVVQLMHRFPKEEAIFNENRLAKLESEIERLKRKIWRMSI